MDFFESETDLSAFHNARILFCIDIERLLVNVVVSLMLWLECILGEEMREYI